MMLFPEPAKYVDGDQIMEAVWEEWKEHTFAIDPQQRAGGLPLRKYTASKEPLGCSLMVNVASDVVIR